MLIAPDACRRPTDTAKVLANGPNGWPQASVHVEELDECRNRAMYNRHFAFRLDATGCKGWHAAAGLIAISS
jgi:hypothetical protein